MRLTVPTGEKVVPIPQEGIITASPVVAGAVVFGRGKNQCGLLVEPRPENAIDPNDESSLIAFRNQIWYDSTMLRGSLKKLMDL